MESGRGCNRKDSLELLDIYGANLVQSEGVDKYLYQTGDEEFSKTGSVLN